MRVTFYDVAPEGRWKLIAWLVEQAWERQRKLVVHCEDPTVARELDEYLWVFRDDAFVPHEALAPGRGPRDAEARVLLVTSEQNPISADILVLETPTSVEFARGFDSVIDLVDHRSPERLAASRARFKAWRDAGLKPDYRRK